MSTTPPPPRPLRFCVLSATLVGHYTACSIVCVVDFLSMSSPILFLHFHFFFFVVSKVLSFLLVLLLIFFFFFMFFSGSRSGACSVSNPGLLAKYACFDANNTYLLIQKSSLSFTLTDSFSSVVSGASSRSHLNVACRG